MFILDNLIPYFAVPKTESYSLDGAEPQIKELSNLSSRSDRISRFAMGSLIGVTNGGTLVVAIIAGQTLAKNIADEASTIAEVTQKTVTLGILIAGGKLLQQVAPNIPCKIRACLKTNEGQTGWFTGLAVGTGILIAFRKIYQI